MGIYLGGILLSLLLFHIFGKYMDIYNYNVKNYNKKEKNDNSSLYIIFSIGWPLFWGDFIISNILNVLVILYKRIKYLILIIKNK